MSHDAPLPKCPLCHEPASWNSGVKKAWCHNGDCPLGGQTMTARQWRRLAAPVYAPEVVAVLKAVGVYVGDPWATATPGPVQLAMRAWIAAGRPGLPEAKEPK
jgi:hypothetical protein